MLNLAAQPNESPVIPAEVRRKVTRRTIPLLFVLYIIAYLDRANAGFAMSPMQKELSFTDEEFGWGLGIFFAGYLLLEIPGAILVEHWSARKWFTRIMVTWGLCSMGMALVRTPVQFATARFLLGLAEAGFFPGVIVYLTHWYPRADRGRAMAGLVIGIPVSLALGAKFSRMVLELDWLDLSGWQWLFISEGFPAVVLGLALPFLMTDRPRDAKWLTAAERNWLEKTLEDEKLAAAKVGNTTLRMAFRRPTLWLLAASIFAANLGGYAMLYWLPTAVKNLLKATNRPFSDSAVLDWLMLVYACGVVGVWVVGRSTDRTGERKWHCALGQIGTGLFLAASVIPGQPWEMVFGWLCVTMFFSFFWPPPFWVLPTLTMSASAAAVSIGFINICANAAGLVGNPVVGMLKSAGVSERVCLGILAGCYIVGGLIISCLHVPKKVQPASIAAPVGLTEAAPREI